MLNCIEVKEYGDTFRSLSSTAHGKDEHHFNKMYRSWRISDHQGYNTAHSSSNLPTVRRIFPQSKPSIHQRVSIEKQCIVPCSIGYLEDLQSENATLNNKHLFKCTSLSLPFESAVLVRDEQSWARDPCTPSPGPAKCCSRARKLPDVC
jgi:hypothetical protein